jgi:polyisoprenoid-binding protein YceI
MDNPTSPFGRQMLAAFQPDRYPTITFVAQRLDLAQARQPLTGELTLRGVTRPFTLNVVFKGVSGDDRAAFTGTGRIRRSEFGITDKRGVVADRVDLAFEVEFVRRQVWP